MLEGIDWVNDAEWRLALFQRTTEAGAKRMLAFNYPHFRTPRVTQVFSSDD